MESRGFSELLRSGFFPIPVRLVPKVETCSSPQKSICGRYKADEDGRLRGALPLSLLSRIAPSVKCNPALVLDAGYWKHRLVVRRSIFNALVGMRYVREIPRWLWLMRAARKGGRLKYFAISIRDPRGFALSLGQGGFCRVLTIWRQRVDWSLVYVVNLRISGRCMSRPKTRADKVVAICGGDLKERKALF